MLDQLPDDVLYLVISNLETARDIRALILTSRRLRTITGDEGWRTFVRSRFPDISRQSLLSSSSLYSWHHLANSLTFQARTWERRSLAFEAIMPSAPSGRGAQRGAGRRRQEAPFHPALDAHLDLSTGEDLVIWGAGENLVARRRRRGRGPTAIPKETAWHSLDGKAIGYRSGVDDIKAVSILEDVCGRPGSLGVLVGRDNGHLALLSAGRESFGERLADLSPQHIMDGGEQWTQGTINSVDVLRRQNLVAVAGKSGAFIYPLPEDEGFSANIAPSTFLNVASQSLNAGGFSLGNAKWMGENTMALGLSGCNDSLRYVTLTPAGFENITTVKNDALSENFRINYTTSRLCTGSLTPIDASSIIGGRGSNLLLSAWRDGSVRLQDLRTPTALDLVYCDNFDPWSEIEALLPFGTSHFVAGGAVGGATIKVFDFRWPRQYYYTTAQPCGDFQPVPTVGQPFLRAPQYHPRAGTAAARGQCDHTVGGRRWRCPWHELSRTLYHRPNAKLFFAKSLPREHADAGVWSMARASSLSPNFYIGISGGVIEASLAAAAGPSPSPSPGLGEVLEVDPNFGYGPSRAQDVGAGYTSYNVDASLMEIGDGRLDVRHDRSVHLPAMRSRGMSRMMEGMGLGTPECFVMRHRLDPRYHFWADFDRSDLRRAYHDQLRARKCPSYDAGDDRKDIN